jgi:hypothetical protein
MKIRFWRWRRPKLRLTMTRALLRNLRRGMRVAFFLRVEPKVWEAGGAHVALIALFSTVMSILLYWTYYGTSAVFDWRGLYGPWLDVVVFLFVSWLAVRYAPRALGPLVIAVALFAAAFVTGVVYVALSHVIRGLTEWPAVERVAWLGLYYGWPVWFGMLAVVLLRRTARIAYRHMPVVIAPLVLWMAFTYLVSAPDYWYMPPPDTRSTAPPQASPVSEEILYLQPKLTRQALADIADQRAGIDDLYFIGFAPHGEEDVFMKESEVIRALMDQRFDTRGRSLLLINNNKTLLQHPLATATNLQAALKTVARALPDLARHPRSSSVRRVLAAQAGAGNAAEAEDVAERGEDPLAHHRGIRVLFRRLCRAAARSDDAHHDGVGRDAYVVRLWHGIRLYLFRQSAVRRAVARDVFLRAGVRACRAGYQGARAGGGPDVFQSADGDRRADAQEACPP